MHWPRSWRSFINQQTLIWTLRTEAHTARGFHLARHRGNQVTGGGKEGWGRGEAEPSPGLAPVLLGWSPAPSSTVERRLGLQVFWGILTMEKLVSRPEPNTAGHRAQRRHRGVSQQVLLKILACISLSTFDNLSGYCQNITEANSLLSRAASDDNSSRGHFGSTDRHCSKPFTRINL